MVFALLLSYLTFLTSGVASWYDLPGNNMADGQPFYSERANCAMLRVPLETKVLIVNTSNGTETTCIVQDRGPFVSGRVIDVSPIVREELRFSGLTEVKVYEVHPENESHHLKYPRSWLCGARSWGGKFVSFRCRPGQTTHLAGLPPFVVLGNKPH
jgi:rare lipoprotein A (peptidoglycan hydrolase)